MLVSRDGGEYVAAVKWRVDGFHEETGELFVKDQDNNVVCRCIGDDSVAELISKVPLWKDCFVALRRMCHDNPDALHIIEQALGPDPCPF